MKVKVSFHGIVKGLVDSPQAELDLAPRATLRDLLGALALRFGPQLRQRLLAGEDSLQSGVTLVINGQPLESESLDATLGDSLQATVEVYILSAISGGQPGD